MPKSKPTTSNNVPDAAGFDTDSKFILLVALKEYGSYSDKLLAKAISTKYRVIKTTEPRDAIQKLSTPGLAGVIVTDGGAAKRSAEAVLKKLAEYAKSGGTVIAGCAFSSFVSEDEFRAFFRAFGLAWKRGAYHRETFYLNTANVVAKANPLLATSYSMKALQVDGISPSMAIYKENPNATRFGQAPVVITKVGSANGRVGYIGDVNDEAPSDKIYLAIFEMLDASTNAQVSPPPSAVPEEPVVMTMADLFGASARPTRAAPSVDASKKLKTSFNMATRSIAFSPNGLPTLVLAALNGPILALERTFSHLLARLREKANLDIVCTRGELEQRLCANNSIGIYVVDGGILKPENTGLYPLLVEYAEAGGAVVCGGFFPSLLNENNSAEFFLAFGLTWVAGPTKNDTYEMLPRSEIRTRNPALPGRYSMNARGLRGLTLNVAIYWPIEKEDDDADDEEEWDAPITWVRIGKGSLGYVGDVSGKKETTPVLVELLGLTKPLASPPTRGSKKFCILVTAPGLGPVDVEKEYGQLLKNIEEKVEVVRGLSVERVTDLMSSPDLMAVLVSSATILQASGANAYLRLRLVEFTQAGGTLVFLDGFAREVNLQTCRDFFLDNWGLDWVAGRRTYTGKDVRLYEKNPLVVAGAKGLTTNPGLNGVATFSSTRSEDVVYVPAGWKGEGVGTGFAQWDGARGRYFEGPVLYTTVGDEAKGRLGFVGGVKDLAEYAKLVVRMVLSDA
ncbi:hypothetical protein DFP72DRAFT_887645 [Ephemerocybe angulata]|uniref:Uncharacterized protein n=1 Tax=Ephemerocybe angulata TaxID=980116 RepID=A0A8H6M8A2_9AGAR|nr:hypothetical protein DFP72DRAFT_887645 [Tulosesus angulatus]